MDISLLNEKSRIFAQADPYAVSDYVNQHVGAHCIRLPRTGRPEASLSHRTFGALDLCRISYGGSVRVTSPALETIYHLQVLLQGHCLWRGHGQEHYFTPGELLLINPENMYHWMSLKVTVEREISEDDPVEGSRVTEQVNRIWRKYVGNGPEYALRDPSLDERRVLFECRVDRIATFGRP